MKHRLDQPGQLPATDGDRSDDYTAEQWVAGRRARGASCALDVGRRGKGSAAILSLLLAVGLAACGAQGTPTPQSARSAGKHVAQPGVVTLIDGRTTSLAALHGRPTLVWFVADGCASCAASIPAVGAHLSEFADAHTTVLVLGIYGAFGNGRQALAQLAAFGRSAAGTRFADPAWTWGVASPSLTEAFDPGGAPDEYFLLDRSGRVAYRGSVPVSTIGSLLTHLKEVAP